MNQAFQKYIDDCYDGLNEIYDNEYLKKLRLHYIQFLNEYDYE